MTLGPLAKWFGLNVHEELHEMIVPLLIFPFTGFMHVEFDRPAILRTVRHLSEKFPWDHVFTHYM